MHCTQEDHLDSTFKTASKDDRYYLHGGQLLSLKGNNPNPHTLSSEAKSDLAGTTRINVIAILNNLSAYSPSDERERGTDYHPGFIVSDNIKVPIGFRRASEENHTLVGVMAMQARIKRLMDFGLGYTEEFPELAADGNWNIVDPSNYSVVQDVKPKQTIQKQEGGRVASTRLEIFAQMLMDWDLDNRKKYDKLLGLMDNPRSFLHPANKIPSC